MPNEPKVILYSADQLDIAAYCLLQQSSFADLFKQNNIVGNYLDPAFFQWKYNTPAGKARIAVVNENGHMVASVAMYPVNLINGDKISTSWHFVEAATLPEARGRGLFKACMQTLIDSLESDELIYVFPNRTSINGTIDLGFQQLQHLQFYAKLILNRKGNSELKSESKVIFSEAQDEYALNMDRSNSIMVLRSAAYMNWRYNEHPHASYYSFAPEQNKKTMGNVVLRAVEIKGIKQLLIMEFHAKNKAVEKQLMSYIKKIALLERCSLAGMFSTKIQRPSFFTTGFMQLPSFVIPKKQILMGINANRKPIQNKNWFCQTGDWDAF